MLEVPLLVLALACLVHVVQGHNQLSTKVNERGVEHEVEEAPGLTARNDPLLLSRRSRRCGCTGLVSREGAAAPAPRTGHLQRPPMEDRDADVAPHREAGREAQLHGGGAVVVVPECLRPVPDSADGALPPLVDGHHQLIVHRHREPAPQREAQRPHLFAAGYGDLRGVVPVLAAKHAVDVPEVPHLRRRVHRLLVVRQEAVRAGDREALARLAAAPGGPGVDHPRGTEGACAALPSLAVDGQDVLGITVHPLASEV
mmetsp:Transcript_8137/g.24733  ORF Transcript_8137/g.24733 Transcript_8137/m.24733 type:complete len:257 (+) Transcript_8137:128-898(+)